MLLIYHWEKKYRCDPTSVSIEETADHGPSLYVLNQDGRISPSLITRARCNSLAVGREGNTGDLDKVTFLQAKWDTGVLTSHDDQGWAERYIRDIFQLSHHGKLVCM
jgi:hypothetical protein